MMGLLLLGVHYHPFYELESTKVGVIVMELLYALHIHKTTVSSKAGRSNLYYDRHLQCRLAAAKQEPPCPEQASYRAANNATPHASYQK